MNEEQEWAILGALADAQPKTLSQISEETGISAELAATLLDDLVTVRHVVDRAGEGAYVIRAEGIEALLARG